MAEVLSSSSFSYRFMPPTDFLNSRYEEQGYVEQAYSEITNPAVLGYHFFPATLWQSPLAYHFFPATLWQSPLAYHFFPPTLWKSPLAYLFDPDISLEPRRIVRVHNS